VLYTNSMTRYLSRISILPLCLASILPLFFMNVLPELWPFVNIIVFTFFFLWTYSIVKKLIEKNKYDSTFSFRSFTILLIATNIYLIFLLLYAAGTYPDKEGPKWMLLIIILGQLFLASSYIYLVGSFAKAISTIELKRKCNFPDYLGNMVLLLFFPIGIWWLHPKIQTLVKD